MPVINQIITLDQAIQRSHATWEVMLGGFGRNNNADLVYPQVFGVPLASLPSVAGIAIGPRSQIDRCWVFWDPQVVINAQLDTPGIDFCRRLTRESPLLFPQYGKKDIPAAPTLVGPSTALRILSSPVLATGNNTTVDDCSSLEVPASFYPETSTVETAFTVLNANGVAGQEQANLPYLHLVFYLKPAQQSPGGVRFPWELNTASIPLSGPGGSPVAPIPVFAGALPVHGRKHVSIQAYAPFTSDAVFDVRVGGLQPGLNTEGGIPKEFTIDDTVLVNASATNAPRLEIENPNCDWLTIWATRDSGAGPVGRLSVKASD